MSILVIGQSAFLAQPLQHLEISKNWYFMGHDVASGTEQWPENIKTVINFACEPKVREGVYSDLDHQYAQKAKDIGAAYITLSSRAVYGVSPEPAELIETQSPYEEITPYGHAKRLIEHDLIENFDHITILRLANIFGFEYSPNYPRPTFFGTMLKSLKEKNEIVFNMGPNTKRDFLPVDIFTSWLEIILQNPRSGIFNLGAGFGTQVGDIAGWVIDGYGSGTIVSPDAEIRDSFVLDMSKTQATYSLPSISAEEIQKHCIEIGQRLKEV